MLLGGEKRDRVWREAAEFRESNRCSPPQPAIRKSYAESCRSIPGISRQISGLGLRVRKISIFSYRPPVRFLLTPNFGSATFNYSQGERRSADGSSMVVGENKSLRLDGTDRTTRGWRKDGY